MHRLKPDFVLSERYRLIEPVASGGMGQVWAALDPTLERRVAIKIMHPHTRDEFALVERFRDEAKFAAQLTHPNIVTIHDFGEHDGLAYLVMELVEGPNLSQLLSSSGALEPDLVRQVILQVAGALGVAHHAGIIHRDIKPGNVLISPGPVPAARLTDFGIARSVDGRSLTSAGELLGTAHYLSPELAMGGPVGPPSDIYSLGLLAHEMLTGQKPFDRGAPIATALAQVQEPPPPLPAGVPADLVELVMSCLAKDPDQRPTADELVRSLEAETQLGQAVAELAAAEPAGLPRRAILPET